MTGRRSRLPSPSAASTTLLPTGHDLRLSIRRDMQRSDAWWIIRRAGEAPCRGPPSRCAGSGVPRRGSRLFGRSDADHSARGVEGSGDDTRRREWLGRDEQLRALEHRTRGTNRSAHSGGFRGSSAKRLPAASSSSPGPSLRRDSTSPSARRCATPRSLQEYGALHARHTYAAQQAAVAGTGRGLYSSEYTGIPGHPTHHTEPGTQGRTAPAFIRALMKAFTTTAATPTRSKGARQSESAAGTRSPPDLLERMGKSAPVSPCSARR